MAMQIKESSTTKKMNQKITLGRVKKSAATLILATIMSACGGGGDGHTVPSMLPATPGNPNTGGPPPGTSSSTTTPFGPVTAKPGPNTSSFVVPQCASCSASSSTQYTGSGTGIWSLTNNGADTEQVPVNISGLKGQTVRLIFSNATDNPANSSTFSTLLSAVPSTLKQQVAVAKTPSTAMAAITEFNHSGFVPLLGQRPSNSAAARNNDAIPPNTFAVGGTRQWFDDNGVVRNTTLVRQGTTGDGTIVDLWVEDSENITSRVSPAIDDSLFSSYTRAGGVYDILTSIGGPLWGAQTLSAALIPANQPINLVVLNFDNNQQPGGLIGYFYSLNNFLPTTTGTTALSNGAIALFLDSETLYLGGTTGMTTITTTMAHESTHMQNFYRRDILEGPQFAYATWLEEQTAMMMEDWASFNLNSSYNNVRDLRAPNYVQEASYNCSMISFDVASATCDSYSVNGSFGGFLDRQLGLSFYEDLLRRDDNTDSQTVLDEAIRAANGSTSFADAFERFSVTMDALVPAANAPAGYNFPARNEGGFSLPAIDPSTFASLSPTSATTPTTTAPATINAFAGFPLIRAKGTGTYGDGVPVPPGVTVSVVIY
jgi:Peptidase M30